MSTRFTLTAATFLAITLFLSACAADPEPTPDPQLPAASNQPPATLEPTPSPQPPAPNLPDLGPAPTIANDVWLNTEGPLTLEALRGDVVLVEFWTFG